MELSGRALCLQLPSHELCCLQAARDLTLLGPPNEEQERKRLQLYAKCAAVACRFLLETQVGELDLQWSSGESRPGHPSQQSARHFSLADSVAPTIVEYTHLPNCTPAH